MNTEFAKSQPVVLVVDDEPANIQVMAACLKGSYRIKVATSAEQCLQLLNSEALPDLILLDIQLHGMDGYTLLKTIREEKNLSNIPVIFVTSRDSETDEEQGLKLGAVDYITKPVRPAIVAARVNTHITLKQQRDQLTSLALHDQLTGLYNRHYLIEMAHHRVARAMRHQHALSLIMLDIDHFKNINDQYGHHTGDEVIATLANIIQLDIRKEDVAARFGGEEFVILLEYCNLVSARELAEKIRTRFETARPSGLYTSASFGVAELRTGEDTFSSLLKRADAALYQAKAQGRNCVICA